VYTDFHHFTKELSIIQQKNEVKGLMPDGFEQVIVHPNQNPYIIKTLQGDHSTGELEDELEMLNENIEFIQIDLPDD
jgi:hypothetical protein